MPDKTDSLISDLDLAIEVIDLTIQIGQRSSTKYGISGADLQTLKQVLTLARERIEKLEAGRDYWKVEAMYFD